ERRGDGAEERVVRVLLDLVTAEVVVVRQVESLKTELGFEPLPELGSLGYRGVQGKGVMPADLAGPERREARGVGSRLQPGIVGEIGATAFRRTGRLRRDRAVVEWPEKAGGARGRR